MSEQLIRHNGPKRKRAVTLTIIITVTSASKVASLVTEKDKDNKEVLGKMSFS